METKGNVYIANHEEISRIRYAGQAADVGTALDIFEQNHGIDHDDKARAAYKALYAKESYNSMDSAAEGDTDDKEE